MAPGFHLKAYQLSRKGLTKPSDLWRKISSSWPEGNFFPLFTSPCETATQTNHCLENPAHKIQKERKEKKSFRAEAERWSGYCMLWCKQHVCQGVHELGPNPRSTQSQSLLIFVGPNPYNFPGQCYLCYESLLSERRCCRTARKAGDGISTSVLPLTFAKLLK